MPKCYVTSERCGQPRSLQLAVRLDHVNVQHIEERLKLMRRGKTGWVRPGDLGHLFDILSYKRPLLKEKDHRKLRTIVNAVRGDL